MSFSMAADFADIFEVRGLKRPTRGHYKPPTASGSKVEFAYQGVDGVTRRTVIEFSPKPDRLEVVGDRVEVDFGAAPRAAPDAGGGRDVRPGGRQRSRSSRPTSTRPCTGCAVRTRTGSGRARRSSPTTRSSTNLLERGLRDLRALYTRSDGGQILAAGIPWYVAVFGRDALIASHQLLTRDHAAGARRAEAARRAPGHEGGRLARRGAREDPARDPPRRARRRRPRSRTRPYYGTRRLHAVVRPPVRAVLPLDRRPRVRPRSCCRTSRAALEWIDRYGDLDGDGFVEYQTRSRAGW